MEVGSIRKSSRPLITVPRAQRPSRPTFMCTVESVI